MNTYKKTPTFFQMEATECGAASLSMVMAYWGHYMALEQMRIETGVSRDGCNAKNIMKAARKYGMEVHGYRKEIDGLVELPTPSIIHWNFNHFVVFEGVKGGYYYLNDPALGRRKLSREELDDGFTGVVITFKPTENFEKAKRPNSLMHFVSERLKGQKSAVTMLVLLGLLLAFPGIVMPVFSEVFVDEILLSGNTNWLSGLIIAMILTVLFQAVLSYCKETLLVKLQSKLALLSGYRFLNKLLGLPIAFFDQRLPGDLSERVDYNHSVSNFLAGDLAETGISIFMAIFYAITLAIYSPLLTLIACVCVAVNLILLKYMSDSMANLMVKFQQDKSVFTGSLYSGLGISDSLKASGTENEYVGRLLGHYANNALVEQQFGKKQNILSAIPDIFNQVTNVIILVVGAMLVVNGKITSGMLVAYASLFGAFVTPVGSLMNFMQRIQTTKADMGRVEDIEKYGNQENDEIADDESKNLKKLLNGKSKLSGDVIMDQVSFGYNILQAPLISDFSFHLPAGQSIALVGSSGSGKSTVAKVVSGLYEPWDGQLCFDGIPFKEINPAVMHASVSVVNQNISVFTGSIRDNITMWNTSILEEDMVRAAKDACIHDMITQKEGAYEYVLTEGGSNLSGGQRQRLEIARALATNPTILIMDEATSALDPLVEKEILNNIKKRGCTCIIVAHRLSAIRDCDQILVLQYGNIVQRGTHEQLVNEEGLYQRLMENR